MYNSNLNLNLYKVFYDVAEAGSVSLAAKELNISQPAISRAIKRLENDLDVTLFNRTLNGMVLTEKGSELLTYVKDACNSLIIGERAMMENDELLKGKLVIGFSNSLSFSAFLKCVEEFHEKYKGVDVTLISGFPDELLRLLKNHEVDIIFTESPILGQEVEFERREVGKAQFGFFIRRDANIDTHDLKDLVNYSVLLPYGQPKILLDELFGNNNVVLSDVIVVASNDMIKSAVKSSDKIGYLLVDSVENELKSGEFQEIVLEHVLPCVTIDLVYIDKFLTKAPRVFIEEYLNDIEI